jgi:hypothetical protein
MDASAWIQFGLDTFVVYAENPATTSTNHRQRFRKDPLRVLGSWVCSVNFVAGLRSYRAKFSASFLRRPGITVTVIAEHHTRGANVTTRGYWDSLLDRRPAGLILGATAVYARAGCDIKNA